MQENKPKWEKLNEDLKKQSAWIKKHGLPMAHLFSEILELRMIGMQIREKEFRFGELNKSLERQMNEVNLSAKEEAIREAEQENQDDLQGHHLTFQQVLKKIHNHQNQKPIP
jgi:hypothetical protein